MTSRRDLLRLLPVALAAPIMSLVPRPTSTDNPPWIEVPVSMSEAELNDFERALSRIHGHYVIVRTDTPVIRRIDQCHHTEEVSRV